MNKIDILKTAKKSLKETIKAKERRGENAEAERTDLYNVLKELGEINE